ncbi:MAG: gamma-glutamyltransferase, partial [Candidatus Latescibacteria bacterium]|nr:gamma-glutamyltransferase [Candidatus Latescibacterota bacterium]
GSVAALDFRETAPAAASAALYLDEEGSPTNRSLYGPLAAGVPGTVRGLEALHERYGSLSWNGLIAPAVRLAAEGFPVRPPLAASLRALASWIAPEESEPDGEEDPFAATRAAFLRDGRAPRTGDRFVQPELAATLERIATDGANGFYRGETAARIDAEMRRLGGILTAEDLERYEAVWREPIRFDYRGHTVVTMPPPSSGGVTMGEIAGILATTDLSPLDPHGAPRVHRLAEAMRRAYADRNTYLGDPAFVAMPLERLLSAEYAERRAASVDPERATPAAEIAPGLGPFEEGEQTTHLSVVDAEGNAVSLTTTINTRFGSLVTVRGAGFLLNNEMNDFTLRPGVANYYGLVQGKANGIAPGKRMLSSMSPTIVLDPEGRLFLVTGSPGGSKIISTVLQTIVHAVDDRWNAEQIVRAPRFHHQHLPDRITFEYGGLPYDAYARLAEMGHALEALDAIGEVQLVRVGPDGIRSGASDPRGSGHVAVAD